MSKLSKLKSRRLQEVYSDMYEKMDKHRRSIIMEKVKIAEKVESLIIFLFLLQISQFSEKRLHLVLMVQLSKVMMKRQS